MHSQNSRRVIEPRDVNPSHASAAHAMHPGALAVKPNWGRRWA